MSNWYLVVSDLFINIAAAWLIVIFIEPQFGNINSQLLILKLILAIMSLVIAKWLRDEINTI